MEQVRQYSIMITLYILFSSDTWYNTNTGSITIGDDSCLGFSACEEIASYVTIGDGSCYGLKVSPCLQNGLSSMVWPNASTSLLMSCDWRGVQACSNVSYGSTIQIANGACIGAQACMSVSGYSEISNSSCLGPKSGQNMTDGEFNAFTWLTIRAASPLTDSHNFECARPYWLLLMQRSRCMLWIRR